MKIDDKTIKFLIFMVLLIGVIVLKIFNLNSGPLYEFLVIVMIISVLGLL